MFGKPEWFVPKKLGWGLHPITWQGWAYTCGWAGVIATPFIVLLTRHQPIEAAIWMVASAATLFYDVYSILQQLNPRPISAQATAAGAKVAKPDDVLYIGDDAEPVATRHFQFRRKT